MNRTLKDATVKRYQYETHEQLKANFQLFLDAYNHAKRLKTLKGLTPNEFICKTRPAAWPLIETESGSSSRAFPAMACSSDTHRRKPTVRSP